MSFEQYNLAHFITNTNYRNPWHGFPSFDYSNHSSPLYSASSPSNSPNGYQESEQCDTMSEFNTYDASEFLPGPSRSINRVHHDSRKASTEIDGDLELDILVRRIRDHTSAYSEGLNQENGQSGSDMDHNAELQIKTEPYNSLGQTQFLHPSFMGLNPALPCDFMQPQSGPFGHPPNPFAAHGIFYPQQHFNPINDSRRGSHGTTSSSSANSHAGTPSPHNSHAPHSPAFNTHLNAHQLLRFGTMFHPNIDFPTASNLGEEDTDKVCAVCGDRAVCFHYGARTCEGCKGFFKRTVQKASKYACAGNRNCPIEKRYRSRCQACRFQKCLSVGMVKEIVRHGSLSGRRGRLSSKTKSHRGEEQPSPPLPLLALIVRSHDAYKPTPNPIRYSSMTTEHVLTLFEREYQSIQMFINSMPNIEEISASDIPKLLSRTFFPIMAVRHCYRMTDNEVVFESGERVPLQGIPAPFMPFFRMVVERASQFKNLVDWEQQSYCALLAMQFFSGNTDSNPLDLASKASADHVQSKIVNALKDHCSAAQPSKLSKIVEQVYTFDCFHELGAEVIEYCLNQRLNLSQQLIAVSDVSRAPLRSGDVIPPLTHQSSGHFSLSHVY